MTKKYIFSSVYTYFEKSWLQNYVLDLTYCPGRSQNIGFYNIAPVPLKTFRRPCYTKTFFSTNIKTKHSKTANKKLIEESDRLTIEVSK